MTLPIHLTMLGFHSISFPSEWGDEKFFWVHDPYGIRAFPFN